MSQKINSNIFRLGLKNNQWDSKLIEKKLEELPTYTFKNLEIKYYIEKFLFKHGLVLSKLKLNFTKTTLNIFISYFKAPSYYFNLIDIQTTFKKSFYNKYKTNFKKKSFFSKKFHMILKKYKTVRAKPLPNIRGLIRQIKIFKESIKYIFFKPLNLNSKNFQKGKNLKIFRLYKYSRNIKNVILYINKKFKLNRKPKRLKILKNYKNYKNCVFFKNLNHLNNKFLKKLTSNLKNFTNSNIFLTLKYLNKPNRLKFNQLKILKPELIGIRYFQNHNFFKNGVNLIFHTISQKHFASILAKFIKLSLEKLKRHGPLFAFLKKSLKIFFKKSFKIKGIKILLKGRFSGAPRSKSINIIIGNTPPLQTIDCKIEHSQSTAFTPKRGTLGIKVWIYKY